MQTGGHLWFPVGLVPARCTVGIPQHSPWDNRRKTISPALWLRFPHSFGSNLATTRFPWACNCGWVARACSALIALSTWFGCPNNQESSKDGTKLSMTGRQSSQSSKWVTGSLWSFLRMSPEDCESCCDPGTGWAVCTALVHERIQMLVSSQACWKHWHTGRPKVGVVKVEPVIYLINHLFVTQFASYYLRMKNEKQRLKKRFKTKFFPNYVFEKI